MFSRIKLAINKNINMSPELWIQLQQFGKIRYLKKNEYLLKAGQVCQHGYYINSGSMVQTFLNKKGKEVVQGFFISDSYSFVSSVNSYFSEQGSDFEIKALENCEIIEFSKSHLEKLATEYHEFALFYHTITATAFQNLYMFSAMRLSLNAEDFLKYLYHHHPIIIQRIPDKYIAQFMGISKEWHSKLKNKMFKSNKKN